MTRVGYGDLLKIPNAQWGKNGGVTWLLRATFGGGDQAAPLPSPLGAPAVEEGSLTLVQTSSTQTISGDSLGIVGTFAGWGQSGYYTTNSFARVVGRALFKRLTQRAAPGLAYFSCWLRAKSLSTSGGSNVAHGYVFDNSSLRFAENATFTSVPLYVLTALTPYDTALVLRSAGALFFIKESGTWKLLWVSSQDNTATLYPGASTIICDYSVDNIGVRDLPAPFDTDYGIATVNTTTFTQSLGPELITNGDFSAWTGDNPDGWTVSGESGSDPMVAEVAGGARFYSSAAAFQPRLRQTIATAGSYYELAMVVDSVVSGSIRFADSSLGVAGPIYTASGAARSLLRFNTTDMLILPQLTPTDITVNSVSAKQVSLNAIHTATADGIHDFNFTVPSPSLIGQRVEMRYRVNDATPDLDYWALYLECTATNVWNIRLDSVAAGVATNRVSVTGYGPGAGATVTLRAICEGSLHDVYTLNGTIWAKRGSQVNVSHQNTSTGLQAVYSSTVTPNSLRSYPRANPAYDAELNKE